MTIREGGLGALIARMGETDGLGYLGAASPAASATNTAPVSSYTFSQGMGLWFSSPSTAMTVISEAFGAVALGTGGLSLPVVQGVIVVPLAAAGLLAWYLMSRK